MDLLGYVWRTRKVACCRFCELWGSVRTQRECASVLQAWEAPTNPVGGGRWISITLATSGEAAREALLSDPDFLRELVEVALQRFLDAGMTEHLQAAPHQRSSARQGYRNGCRRRQLKPRVGTLELAVPVDREGTAPFAPSCSSATREARRPW